MFAMKTWLAANQHHVLPVGGDHEKRKHLVAEHAAEHPNKLLGAHPRFTLDARHAASVPIKVGVMRTWLGNYFGMEW